MAETGKEDIKRFSVGVVWEGDGKGCGEVAAGAEPVKIPIAGSKELDGCGIGTNPEELLLAAIGACFVNTWAIFLKKLSIGYAEPSIRVTGELGKDPAGGFKMLSSKIYARVPASLLAERRADVQKTLSLAEKYCIISKVARGTMSLEVAVEEV
ncbi:MAG TPA: OsmC family protein [Thermoanaerobaculia bacterium]|nr:OsmC family protein [Thermoanaerobaculia bacterium]